MKKSAVALLVFTAPWVARAGTCSLCRESLRSGGSDGLIRGYYWSIVLIALVPLIVLGVGLRYSWRRYKTSAARS